MARLARFGLRAAAPAKGATATDANPRVAVMSRRALMGFAAMIVAVPVVGASASEAEAFDRPMCAHTGG